MIPYRKIGHELRHPRNFFQRCYNIINNNNYVDEKKIQITTLATKEKSMLTRLYLGNLLND